MENGKNIAYFLRLKTNIRRSNESLWYLKKCSEKGLLPRFTFIGRQIVEKGELSSKKVRKLRQKRFEKAIKDHEQRILINESKWKKAAEKLSKELSKRLFTKINVFLDNEVKRKEFKNDRRRDRVFANEFRGHRINQSKDIGTIKIHNDTSVTIPKEITEVLKYGLQHPIGGKANPVKILASAENFFAHWRQHAIKNNIDPLKIQSVRNKIYGEVDSLFEANTDISQTKILSEFLDKNPSMIICPVDKSKDLQILSKSDYIDKLKDAFEDNSRFQKLPKSPLNSNLSKCQALVRTMKPYINKKIHNNLAPYEQLKQCYGIIKKHKINSPIRPIVSSIGSITIGCEEYILGIIGKFNLECEYSLESTKDFKTFLMSNRNKFDEKIHSLSSIDARNLYPSINLQKVIEFIVEKIYNQPDHYFGNINDPNNPTVKISPKPVFNFF